MVPFLKVWKQAYILENALGCLFSAMVLYKSALPSSATKGRQAEFLNIPFLDLEIIQGVSKKLFDV